MPIFEPFSLSILFGLGFGLIALEVLLGSFFVLWFGLGFLIVGLVHWVYPFSDGLWQLISVAVISAILLILFYKRLKKFIKKSEKEIKQDFLNEQGYGVYKEGMIDYKGTMWKFEPSLDLNENERVRVLKTHKSTAFIEKL